MIAELLAASLAVAQPALNAAPICGCRVAPEGLPNPEPAGQLGQLGQEGPAAPPAPIDVVVPWTPAEAQRLASCSPGSPPKTIESPPPKPPSRGERR